MARLRSAGASWLYLSCVASVSSSLPALVILRKPTLLCLLRGYPGNGWCRRSNSVLAKTTSTPTRIASSSFSLPRRTPIITRKMLSPGAVGQADIGRHDGGGTVTNTPTVNAAGADDTYDDYLPSGTSWRRLLQRSSTVARSTRGSNYVQLATVDLQGKPRCRSVVFRGFLALPPNELPRTILNATSGVCDGLPCVLQMTTDKRSQKVQHALKENSAELVWWFPRTNEQYRIAGQLWFVGAGGGRTSPDRAAALYNDDDGRVVESTSHEPPPNNEPEPLAATCHNPHLQEARQRMWIRLSDAARQSFFARSRPGQPFVEDDFLAAEEKATASVNGADGSTTTAGLSPPPPPPDNFLLMLLVPDTVDYLRLTSMYRQVDTIQEDGEWVQQRVNP